MCGARASARTATIEQDGPISAMTTMSTPRAPLFDLAGKRVYVAGHRGMVGSAIVRRLRVERCTILIEDRQSLDLTRQTDTEGWLARMKPDVVVVAAARVGGIAYNNANPVDFL